MLPLTSDALSLANATILRVSEAPFSLIQMHTSKARTVIDVDTEPISVTLSHHITFTNNKHRTQSHVSDTRHAIEFTSCCCYTPGIMCHFRENCFWTQTCTIATQEQKKIILRSHMLLSLDDKLPDVSNAHSGKSALKTSLTGALTIASLELLNGTHTAIRLLNADTHTRTPVQFNVDNDLWERSSGSSGVNLARVIEEYSGDFLQQASCAQRRHWHTDEETDIASHVRLEEEQAEGKENEWSFLPLHLRNFLFTFET